MKHPEMSSAGRDGPAREARESFPPKGGAMDSPSAEYLRSLVSGLIADASTPRSFRNECHQLLLAINSNDVTEINGILARLRALANEAGVRLPDMNTTREEQPDEIGVPVRRA
jgi:hypothetical protein